MPKYLTYSIDKYQSTPTFRDDFPEWLKSNCDEGFDVVVDMETKMRYFLGEWVPVECV